MIFHGKSGKIPQKDYALVSVTAPEDGREIYKTNNADNGKKKFEHCLLNEAWKWHVPIPNDDVNLLNKKKEEKKENCEFSFFTKSQKDKSLNMNEWFRFFIPRANKDLYLICK